MPDIDYAPVTSPEDEEEQRRRLYGSPYPGVELGSPSPFQEYGAKSPGGDASLAVTPSAQAPAASAGPPPVTGDSYLADQYKAGTVGEPAMSPARTRLKTLTDQGAPAVEPLHGWKKVADIAAKYWAPGVEQSIRYAPQREYQANLKQAESDVAGENVGPTEDAAVREKNAKASQEESKADELRNPKAKPKEEVWKAVAGVTDPQGRILQEEQNSGQMRWAPNVSGAQPLKEPAEKNKTEEQQFKEEYKQKHPNATEAEAQHAFKQNEHIADPTAKNDARSDRSYQFHAGRIDKLRQPVEQRLERISRLEDTLDQGTPQADALVAPELLTIMAGGQGSGLRMNEAEIARIIGGRNVWQDLKAKLEAFRLDPSKGFAITPEQREQVRSIFNAVKERTSKKMSIIDEESGHLIESDNPKDHRQVYNRLQHRLSEADGGTGDHAGGGETKTYQGHEYEKQKDGSYKLKK